MKQKPENGKEEKERKVKKIKQRKTVMMNITEAIERLKWNWTEHVARMTNDK